MITLNGKEVSPKYFSDGALDIKIEPELLNFEGLNIIGWRFDKNEELISIYFLTRHLQSKGIRDVELRMPYIPNARKDKAQREKDVFSLKYFAEIINQLQFSRVVVLDPHSTVSEALIDRIRVITPEGYIHAVLEELGDQAILFYPDEGAVKRYADKTDRPYVYGMKTRDKTTRVINDYRIEGDLEIIAGRDILMVDDICASGKTLAIAAGKLKELGAGELFVFVSHCENAAVKSGLLELITRLYTTDSIFRETHPKIRLLPS
ncbi:MAG: ribose-phosphate pyrophosphokinase [Lachnospiraceae bacterium]|nr:ribose-phosphate pyrophosphokinase [Lachnospiraceae bacterium]